MKFLNILLIATTLSTPTIALESGKFRIVGTIKSLTEKSALVKTNEATLIIPKALIPKENLKTDTIIELELSQSELDQIKIKK